MSWWWHNTTRGFEREHQNHKINSSFDRDQRLAWLNLHRQESRVLISLTVPTLDLLTQKSWAPLLYKVGIKTSLLTSSYLCLFSISNLRYFLLNPKGLPQGLKNCIMYLCVWHWSRSDCFSKNDCTYTYLIPLFKNIQCDIDILLQKAGSKFSPLNPGGTC